MTRDLLRACRFMGGWTWADLMRTPPDVIEEVFNLMRESSR